MGLQPALFANPVYKKMNNIRVVVANSPTKIATMKNALYGGMAPPKKGRTQRKPFSLDPWQATTSTTT